jgi:Putative auto-transporter adhesin, head GIN domain
MKKGFVIIFVIIAAIVIFSSCYDFHLRCIRGNGNLIEEIRNNDNFSSIISTGSFDIFISHDTVFEVLVEAEENLLQYIETEVVGSKLYIEERDNRCLRTTYPIVVRIKVPEVTSIDLTGSGDIVCDSINTEIFDIDLVGSGDIRANVWADFIEVDLTGSGEINLTGEADQTDFSIPGSGNIRTLDLLQNECYASIPGSGNIYVNVSEFLEVRISGSGNVYYLGNPVIDYQISGSGDIISINN